MYPVNQIVLIIGFPFIDAASIAIFLHYHRDREGISLQLPILPIIIVAIHFGANSLVELRLQKLVNFN